MLGLTHPADGKWFGYHAGRHFFRLADGDRYIAVLRTPTDAQLVDAIPVEDAASDPRPIIKRLATEYACRRGWMRR